jgi:pimeloyl-ACP methyl ester carboxylesterase
VGVTRSSREAAAIVYVHGLWLTGGEAFVLRHDLRARGFDWHTFHYASVSSRMEETVLALRRLIAQLDAPEVHLLGHSLGGLVILCALHDAGRERAGRAVFLGTPSLTSRAAQSVARLRLGARPLGTRMLGHAARELLNTAPRRWTADRELGIVAGTRPLSLARAVVRFDEPNDGAVAVSETRLPGAKAYLSVPVSHIGLLFSRRVAAEVAHFLERGAFITR